MTDQQAQPQQIDADQARQLIDSGATLVDVRDSASFRNGHISGAYPLDSDNVQSFIDQADLDAPCLVYCFHGQSSLSAAQFLLERGFDEVYSLTGGFAAWQQRFPQRCVCLPETDTADPQDA